MIHISTSEVYGNPEILPITENHPLKPQSPYAASKSAADLLVLAHSATYGVPVTVVRPFNTYGPRQSQRAVIPTILAQFLSGKEIIEIGSLDSKRDFTYVTDTTRGILDVATNKKLIGEVTQLGTGEVASVGEIIELVKELTGRNVRVRSEHERTRPSGSEVWVLHSNPTKAREMINWLPKIPLKEGLKLTLDWMIANQSKIGNSDAYYI